MKYYEDMLDKKCFSFKDAEQLVGGNCNTAKSLLRQYVKKGYIQQVKKNLYILWYTDRYRQAEYGKNLRFFLLTEQRFLEVR